MSKSINFQLDMKEFSKKLKGSLSLAMDGAKRGMNDSVDEMVRISSEITPLDKGTLAKSHSREVKASATEINASISYYVQERGFNYALYMHEADYELGEESRKRSGTSGWSGKSYDVGNKYLERPIKGEQQAIRKHIANEIKKSLGG